MGLWDSFCYSGYLNCTDVISKEHTWVESVQMKKTGPWQGHLWMHKQDGWRTFDLRSGLQAHSWNVLWQKSIGLLHDLRVFEWQLKKTHFHGLQLKRVEVVRSEMYSSFMHYLAVGDCLGMEMFAVAHKFHHIRLHNQAQTALSYIVLSIQKKQTKIKIKLKYIFQPCLSFLVFTKQFLGMKEKLFHLCWGSSFKVFHGDLEYK